MWVIERYGWCDPEAEAPAVVRVVGPFASLPAAYNYARETYNTHGEYDIRLLHSPDTDRNQPITDDEVTDG